MCPPAVVISNFLLGVSVDVSRLDLTLTNIFEGGIGFFGFPVLDIFEIGFSVFALKIIGFSVLVSTAVSVFPFS